MRKTYKVLLPNGRVLNLGWEGKEPGIGWRVLVKTKSGGATGIVVGEGTGEEGGIISVPDEGPLVLPHHLEIVGDLSRDYLIPRGVLLFKLLPSVFDWYQEEVVKPSPKKPSHLDKESERVLEYVRRRREVKEESLKKKFGAEVVKLLIEKGFLIKETKWVQPETEVRYYRLKVPLNEALKAVRGEKLKEFLLRMGESGTLSEEEAKGIGVSARTLRSLVRKGILEEVKESLSLPTSEVPFRRPKEIPKDNAYLWGGLEGVLETLLDFRGGSCLFLFTRSELLRKALPLLKETFGGRLVEIHGGVGGKKLFENWFLCLKGEKVVVGTYLALLSPLPDLTRIVLVDESSQGVKPPAVGVDIRRAVLYLSKRVGASVVFTSPSPSVASYYLVKKGSFSLKKVSFTNPEVFIVKRSSADVLAEETVKLLEGEESVLFLVRKEGYGYGYCPRCEGVAECPECGTFLTLSKEGVRCTGCTKFRTEEKLCPRCGGDLEEMGFGVEKALEEVGRTLGLKEGFSFSTYPPWGEKYDSVVILSADGVLSLPTYRAEEEFFLYFLRSYICAKKKLILQTAVLEAEILKFVEEKNFEQFYEEELRRREAEKLPPFWRLVLISSRRDIGGYLRRVVSPEVRTVKKGDRWEHLIRFKDKETLLKVGDLKKRFGKDIIEVRVDPF